MSNKVRLNEAALYQCALAVEKDVSLKADLANWTNTIADGLAMPDAVDIDFEPAKLSGKIYRPENLE